MSNTHGAPDTLKEIQSISADLLPVCVLSTTGLTPPGSGLTLTGVSATAYALQGTDLKYIDQPSITVTVPSVAGVHWLIAHADTHSAVASWTRIAGSHLLQRQNATAPAMPDGGVLLAQITVTGTNITAVNTGVALSPPLSRQTADAVAITGGTAVLSALQVDPPTLVVDPVTHRVGIGQATPLFGFDVNGTVKLNNAVGMGKDPVPGTYILDTAGGNVRHSGTLQVGAQLGVGLAPVAFVHQAIAFDKSGWFGLVLRHLVNDTGSGIPVVFQNLATTTIGSITSTASNVAYNTSSDSRLKRAIARLDGALDVVRQLRPVRFRWRQDDTPGVGFVAEEVAEVVAGVTTGTPGAVTPEGHVDPMQMDASKLLPYVVGALQTLVARVESLEAHLASR